MSDIRIAELISLEGPTMDWFLRDTGQLDEREELATAVRLALGTDSLSDADEILPDPDSTDRRGWWGDLDAELIWDGWPIGCKNWLLSRAKILDAPSSEGSTLQRAQEYTATALQPFIDKGIATRIDVTAARTELNRIVVNVVIYRGPKVEINLRYQFLWEEEGVLDEFRVTTVDTKIRIPYATLSLTSLPVISPVLTDYRLFTVPQGNLQLSSLSLVIGKVSPKANLTLATTAPIILQNAFNQIPKANIALSPTAPSVAATMLAVGSLGFGGIEIAASTDILLTSGTQWTVPSDCVLINYVECTAAGAPGATGATAGGVGGFGGNAGGGGAYARKNSVATTPGSVLAISIGLNSAGTNFGSGICFAAGASGSTGGAAGSCVGDVRNSGANGGGGAANNFSGGGTGGTGGAGASPYGGAGGPGGVGNTAGPAGAGLPGGGGGQWGGGGGGGAGGDFDSGLSINYGGGAGGSPYQGFIYIHYTSSIYMSTTATAPTGATIVVGVMLDTANSVTVTALNDGTNTYTKIDGTGLVGSTDISLWRTTLAAPLASGTKITATFSGATGAGTCNFDAAYATGLSAATPDKFAHVSATSGTSLSVATGVLSQPLELVFGFGGDISGLSTTVYNGATGFNNTNKSAASRGVATLDWQITHATTTVTFGPSWGSATRMGAIVASFKG